MALVWWAPKEFLHPRKKCRRTVVSIGEGRATCSGHQEIDDEHEAYYCSGQCRDRAGGHHARLRRWFGRRVGWWLGRRPGRRNGRHEPSRRRVRPRRIPGSGCDRWVARQAQAAPGSKCPKAEPPKSEPPKSEPPKSESSKSERPKSQCRKAGFGDYRYGVSDCRRRFQDVRRRHG